ncbi:ABC transporter permease [Psychrobacillus glaciei]|uniref:ABC transporter permease n=1 Tax=Psychrobacillus glaciei TaxID=2283160 RepID=A0A5J6SHZ4_9BACI|nr:ABC transporter permease [Psychrobacillus glaciei]QFF97535.1 ABC transporter permease [Psychrobacillus glaciei]
MKKFGLLALGIIAGIVALASLGSLIGLAISALVVFAGVHFYLKSDSTFLKIFWATVGIIGLFSAVANVPGFFGILAIVVVLYVVKKWNKQSFCFTKSIVKSDDPFVNFEKQWNELSK